MPIYLSTLLFLALISTSCSKLTPQSANEIFLKENPTYTILASETGENWEGVEYHQFTFKKPNDDKVYKEIWCFVQKKDNVWRVTDKWIPKE